MPEQILHTVQTYAAVYVTLMLLLGLTVGAAFIPMGVGNPITALVIAFAKTALIATFFMHLQRDSAIVRITAAAGLVWLSLLFAFSLADYLTRPADGMGAAPVTAEDLPRPEPDEPEALVNQDQE